MSSILMPHFLRNSCKTQCEAEPKRVMATFLPFSSAGVLMSGRTISLCRPVLRGEAVTTVSAPLKDERMTESPPPTENWISPAIKELTTRDAPPPMTITSASMPCFLKRPFSSATQMLPEVALIELSPTLMLSAAKRGSVGSNNKDRITFHKHRQAALRPIDDLLEKRNE